MTEHVWTVDYQIFPDDIGPLGVPTGACFAYRNGEEIDCVEIERRLNEYETLKAATEELTVVFDEIKRQDDKWGEQRTHPPEWWYPILGEEFGELGKAMLENHFDYPNADSTDVKKELVQVIAVGIQWLKSIAYADILEGK